MSTPKTVSPEMHAVLAEVLAQPKSKLLAPNPACLRGVDLGAPISAGAPFLTSAERKLVGGYRDELEWVFWHWGQLALYGGGWGRREMNGSQAKLSMVGQQLVALGQQATIQLKSGKTLESPVDAYANSDKQAARVAQECLARAQSLIIRDSTRTCMGISYIKAREYRSAGKQFSKVLWNSHDELQGYIAGINLGGLHLRIGDYAGAITLLSRIERKGIESARKECFLLLGSGLLLDWEGIAHWSDRLCEAGGLENDSIPELIRTLRYSPEVKKLQILAERHPRLLENEVLRALVRVDRSESMVDPSDR